MIKKEKIFSSEEKEFILNNYPAMSVWALKNKFNCSWYAVAKVLTNAGIVIPKSNKWTEDEINQLIKLSKKKDAVFIANKLGRTYGAVYEKAHELGIPIIPKGGRVWTDEEIAYLEDNWGRVTLDYIAKKLKRSHYAIKVKAQRLGLGSLLINSGILSISELCEMIGVSRERITRWERLGLRIGTKPVTFKCRYKYIKIEDLLSFLKDHPSEYDATKIKTYSLGIEPSWLKEKRKIDSKTKEHLRSDVNRRYWTQQELKILEVNIKAKIPREQIAKRLGRKVTAVNYKACELGYGYRLPQYWTGKELKFIKDNYKIMTHLEMAKQLGRPVKSVAYQCNKYGYYKKGKKAQSE